MPTMRSRRRPPAPRLAALLAGLAVTALVAACGSGSSASGGSGGSGSGASGKLTSADQSGLTQAKAFLVKAEQRPTQITATGKIGKAVPRGKTIDWISCGNTPECTQEGNIVKQAASLLHWNTVILSNNGSPQDEKADFNQVVRTKPAAVLYSAIPAATFASEVPAMKKNGTFISACCITDAVGASTGIGYAVGLPDQIGSIAGSQAALVAAGSQDTGNVLVVNIPDFEILNVSTADFYHSMASYCPTCKVSKLNIALANIGTATSTTVSYLRAHPSIKWVVAETDALTIGLPAALKEAGLSDVKIIGQGATPTNIQYLHSNEQYGDVAFPYFEDLYAMVNSAAQHEAGVAVTPSSPAPLWVLTPSSAPPMSAAAFPVVANYKSEYGALWGLSS